MSLQHAKTAFSALARLQKTAKIATLAGLRVATGETADAKLLAETFQRLGATYIKLGQFIASTPSLFPQEYVTAFADCLDNTTPIRFALVEAVIDKELAHIGGVAAFASIDPIPLASASIAQVHKATLKNGDVVAIKVQKPDVLTTIHTDLSVLQAVAWALQKAIPAMSATNLTPILKEIKERMLCETDFIKEADNLRHFASFLKEAQIQGVQTPSVYDSHSTKKVLTMRFLSGVSLVDGNLGQADPRQVMGTVLDTWFLSLIQTGQFHADLHAGNLLLLNNGDVAFLDFGLVGQIDPKRLYACLALAQALQQNDHHRAAQAMVAVGMTKEHIDTARLADDLASFELDGQSASELNVKLAALGKQYGIQFPKDFALLTKQLLYFDRFLQALAPEMDVFARPVTHSATHFASAAD